jgi:hypothetical protein
MPERPPLSDDTLHAEALALGRFIVGRPIAPALVDRYVEAHRHLFEEEADGRDRELVAFAARHPRLLPSLDAALALTRPDALLHRKALLMAAILEASPDHADDFLPRTRSLAGLVALGARVGLRSAVEVAIGLPLLAVLGRRM